MAGSSTLCTMQPLLPLELRLSVIAVSGPWMTQVCLCMACGSSFSLECLLGSLQHAHLSGLPRAYMLSPTARVSCCHVQHAVQLQCGTSSGPADDERHDCGSVKASSCLDWASS